MVIRHQFQPPSTDFLKKLGYRFSRTLLNHDNMQSENYLWRAVVVNALEDTMIIRDDRKSATLKTNAHLWIINNCKDFDRVCGWAMLDSEQVSNAYKKAVDSKQIIFSNRHLYWLKYNFLFKKFKSNIDSRMKRNIKKEMKDIKRAALYEEVSYDVNVHNSPALTD